MEIVKIGSVELYEDDVRKLYEQRKYIVTYGGVLQICYSNERRNFMVRKS